LEGELSSFCGVAIIFLGDGVSGFWVSLGGATTALALFDFWMNCLKSSVSVIDPSIFFSFWDIEAGTDLGKAYRIGFSIKSSYSLPFSFKTLNPLYSSIN
jgi:hypothetical protein